MLGSSYAAKKKKKKKDDISQNRMQWNLFTQIRQLKN